ncbi:MAG: prefoldin subunit alpha [Methanoregula sp.]|nr:prefoldin subunit alpha [Methanoregula sp.]
MNKEEPMDQRELLTLEHYLKQYGQQAEIFASQLELMENGRMEALAAVEALQGDKVLLNIGAEVIVERTNKDAVEFLKDRIMEMEASEKKVVEALDRLRSQMNEITKRLEQGYQQTVQAGRAVPAGSGNQDQ